MNAFFLVHLLSPVHLKPSASVYSALFRLQTALQLQLFKENKDAHVNTEELTNVIIGLRLMKNRNHQVL